MRIAFVSGMSGHAWGGSEELWSKTALRMSSRGHDVWAYVNRNEPRPRPVAKLIQAGVNVVEGDPKRKRFRARVAERAKRSLAIGPHSIVNRRCKEQLLHFKPQLVCISNGAIACGLDWMTWCKDHHIPFAPLCQANSEACWPVDSAAAELRDAYQAAEHCFFVSQRNRELFELQIGSRLFNASIVRNPLSTGIPEQPLPMPRSSPVVFASVGRLAPMAKGQDLLLQVLAEPQWANRAMQLDFYGGGEMAEGVKRIAKLLGLEARVRFHGHVQDIRNVWQRSHALVLPSRYEGLPLAVAEAMACGRVAIVTDVAGNTEIVDDGVNGFVAESATVRHYSAAMERAWESRSKWSSLGQAAHDTIHETYPLDSANAFADTLLSLVDDHGQNTSLAESKSGPARGAHWTRPLAGKKAARAVSILQRMLPQRSRRISET